MIENFIVAITNITVFYPIYLAWNNNDVWTAWAFAFVGFFSFVSHLAENHKHGMPGIGLSKSTSYILNRFDVLGVILSLVRMLVFYYQQKGLSVTVLENNRLLTVSLIIAWSFNLYSEHDKYNKELKTRYIILHSIWHLSIFVIAGLFYKEISL